MGFELTDSKEKIVHAQNIVKGSQQKDPFFQFQGTSPEQNIIIITPESKKGFSQVTFKIVTDLVGDGVSGNQNLSENRDELNFVPFSIKGKLIANSLESPVDVLMDRTTAELWRRENQNALTNWITRQVVRRKFYALSANGTNVVAVKANGTVTNPAGLSAGDKFSSHTLDEMLDRAKNGWTDSAGVEHPSLEPYTTETRTEHGITVTADFYPLFIGPKSLKALNDDPIFKAEQVAKETSGRFSSLSGFAGVYQNIVLIEVGKDIKKKAGILTSDSLDYDKYTNMAQYKAGDGTHTEINLLLGIGAGCMPFDTEPRYGEDPNADSGRKVIAFIDMFYGFEKTRWIGETMEEKKSIYHDKDYGVIIGLGTVA